MIFLLKANGRNLDFFCKIDIFSETISSGRTHFAIWGIKTTILGNLYPGFEKKPQSLCGKNRAPLCWVTCARVLEIVNCRFWDEMTFSGNRDFRIK